METRARAATVRLVNRALSALRGIDPRVGDWLLAAAGVVALGIEVAVYADGDAQSLVIGAITCVGMASLALRRSHPMAVAIVIGAVAWSGAVFAPDVYSKTSAQFIAAMIAMYSVGRHANRVAATMAVVLLLGIATLATDSLEAPQQILWLGVLTGGPLAIGRVIRNRSRLQAQLRESARVLERDRARRAESAVEEERARLAGELQAVIANGVSAIVVQAEAVPRVLAAGRGEVADAALERIEDAGRETLAETRRLLGILRRDDDGPALVPQPTLADLAVLAESFRSGGLAVDLTVAGDPAEIATGPDLAAYRVVQQALEDAVSSGAETARILVEYEPDELRLEVRDDRDAAAIDPDRLLAMRERLGLYGGRVRAGIEAEHGGFSLLARVPLTGVPA
jgi:signal transduction histidine kinase